MEAKDERISLLELQVQTLTALVENSKITSPNSQNQAQTSRQPQTPTTLPTTSPSSAIHRRTGSTDRNFTRLEKKNQICLIKGLKGKI